MIFHELFVTVQADQRIYRADRMKMQFNLPFFSTHTHTRTVRPRTPLCFLFPPYTRRTADIFPAMVSART